MRLISIQNNNRRPIVIDLEKTFIGEMPELETGQNTVISSSEETRVDLGAQISTSTTQSVKQTPEETGELFPTQLLTKGSKEQAKIMDLLEDVLIGDGLDLLQAQRLLRESPEFKARFRKLICHCINPNRPTKKKHTIKPSGYDGGYQEPKPISDQLEILRNFFPKIGDINLRQANVSQLSLGIGEKQQLLGEGQFVIVRWKSINNNYAQAFEEILQYLKYAYRGRFFNNLKGFSPNQFRLLERTEKGFQKLYAQQFNSSFMIATCQFGKKHAAKSVHETRGLMPSYEFEHDPFSVACMLLTHPERLSCSGTLTSGDLFINCAGASCLDSHGTFSDYPFFGIDNKGNILLDAGSSHLRHPSYGSSSFFVLDLE